MTRPRPHFAEITSVSARPVPPPSDLLKLWVAALSNARNLLAAARLLAEAGMIPPAHALATFANEEQGKAGLCFMVAMSHGQGVDSAAFRAEFKGHRPKLRRAEGVSGLLLRPPPASVRQFINQVAQAAAAAHERRLRGLYVDYQHDSKILLPNDVTAEEARDLIDDVQRSIDNVAPMCDFVAALDDVSGLLAAMEEVPARFAELMQEVVEVSSTVGEDRMIAALRQAWQRSASEMQPRPEELEAASAEYAADDSLIAAGRDAAFASLRGTLADLRSAPLEEPLEPPNSPDLTKPAHDTSPRA